VRPIEVQGSIRSRYSPSALAFLGDAVWEGFLRIQEFPMHDQTSLHDYHLAVKKNASAVQQAVLHDKLTQSPDDAIFQLTAEETDILRWAGNSSAVSPPRGVEAWVYKKATALECLVAYLYLTDLIRCQAMMKWLVGPPTDYPPPSRPSQTSSLSQRNQTSKAKKARDNKSWN
jgi:ribonuclease-3 family protein